MEQQAAGGAMLPPEGLTNIQTIRPGAPHKSVATVSPWIQRPEPTLMPPQIVQAVPGFTLPGHVLLKTDSGQFQLVRVGQVAPPAQGGRHSNLLASQGVLMMDAQVSSQSIQQHLSLQEAPSGRDNFGLTPQQVEGQQLQQQLWHQQQLQQQQLQQQNFQEQPRMLEYSWQQPQMQQMQQHPQMLLHSRQEPQTQQIGQMQQFPQQHQMPQQLSMETGSQPAPSQPAQHRRLDSSTQKCQKFLENLLELSSKESVSIQRNVRTLIQELIDGTEEANEFCIRLERLLNASPQPSLTGFLMKSLPRLRLSLALRELTIEGIIAPEVRVAFPPPKPQLPSLPCQVALSTPDTPNHGGIAAIQNIAVASGSGGASGKSMTINKQAYAPLGQPPLVTVLPPGQSMLKEKGKKRSLSPGAFNDYKMAGEDDINDVAAMGGVNLQEESQRILGNNDAIGSQIRSCNEENQVASSLAARVQATFAARGMTAPTPEVLRMLSHALDHRMRSLIGKVVSVAIHRKTTDYKRDAQYEVTQDVRGQLRFIEEVERAEARRRGEAERELLLRAAKSRSKSEDPEQAKLKAKAKEMQRVEMEELRQREANLTALQAIGPRKKPRLEPVAAAASVGVPLVPPPPMRVGPRAPPRRLTMQDMLHFLENDRFYAHSQILYKAYLMP